jgi:hypothetical protein
MEGEQLMGNVIPFSRKTSGDFRKNQIKNLSPTIRRKHPKSCYDCPLLFLIAEAFGVNLQRLHSNNFVARLPQLKHGATTQNGRVLVLEKARDGRVLNTSNSR